MAYHSVQGSPFSNEAKVKRGCSFLGGRKVSGWRSFIVNSEELLMRKISDFLGCCLVLPSASCTGSLISHPRRRDSERTLVHANPGRHLYALNFEEKKTTYYCCKSDIRTTGSRSLQEPHTGRNFIKPPEKCAAPPPRWDESVSTVPPYHGIFFPCPPHHGMSSYLPLHRGIVFPHHFVL